MLLGIIGLVYQLFRNLRDWAVVGLLFFFTGFAIVLYLNQYPIQPRERDYAYVGSFYAFTIWIGLGVYALFDAAQTMKRRELGMVVGAALGLGVLRYMVEAVGGDDHSVSYSIFYMGLLGGLFLAAFHFLGGIVKNDTLHGVLATVLCLMVPGLMLAEEWDDHDRSRRVPARDLAADYLNSCAPNAILFTNGDNDTFPLWYAQEVEGIRTDVRVVNLSLLNTDWYIDQMRRKAYDSDPIPLGTPPEKYRQGTRDVVVLLANQNPKGIYVDIKDAVDFATNDKNLQALFSKEMKDAYIPSDRFKISVDKAKVLSNGTVQPKDSALVLDEVKWRIPRQMVMKNHFTVLDLLANFNWDRPIYFAVTTGPDSYINLQDHFQLEGLTYRLVPIISKNDNPNQNGRVGTDVMYRNVMEKFLWGNMETTDDIYLDENILRMTMNLRLQLSTLAEALIAEDRKEEARNVLDLSVEKMPDRNVPYDRIMLPTIEAYYALGENEKANAVSERLFEILADDLEYYMSLEPEFAARVSNEMAITHAVLDRIVVNANSLHPQPELGPRLKEQFDALDEMYRMSTGQPGNGPRRETKARF